MLKAIGVFVAVLAATTFATAKVHAETGVRGGVDWGRLLVELDSLARGKSAEKKVPPSSPALMRQDPRTSQLVVQNAGNAWFGVAPRVTLVARDWGSAFRVAGDQLSLVDAVRLSESTRMVISRVRMTSAGTARVVPFVQLGAGQWRTDPKLLPLTPRNVEIAAQVGAGVEVTITKALQLACETSATAIVRDARGPSDLPQTRLWSAALAARVAF